MGLMHSHQGTYLELLIPSQGPHMYPTSASTYPYHIQSTNIRRQICYTQPLGKTNRDWGGLGYTYSHFHGLAITIGWGLGAGNMMPVISSVI